MQVSTAEAQRRGIMPESLPRLLFDPCFNLQVGWQILQDGYNIETKTYGPGQEALQHAISRYNTGDTQRGIDNGYLARVMAALKQSPATMSMTKGASRR
jgi:type IV secretion system protein VirB1